ncbi:hypothetical protein N7541_002257 [Penicillium brevicompactum]|uniref:Uncharacterized protein n=1 Tax=Penicillium brevicompactum TaxID=5074 RepID=A0A9W9RJI6_PENBR|nr:hypothetical protein N7541_002257 [Penicillium brevicompactum]
MYPASTINGLTNPLEAIDLGIHFSAFWTPFSRERPINDVFFGTSQRSGHDVAHSDVALDTYVISSFLVWSKTTLFGMGK